MSRACRFVSCVLLWAVLALAPHAALAAPPAEVALQQDRSVPGLGQLMQAFLDDGRGLAATVRAFRDGEFSGDLEAVARAGEPYQPVWTAILLTNATPDDGRAADEWIAEIHTYGIVGADAYLIRADGLTETLLRHSIRKPFDPSTYNGMQLRTEPVRLAPGETALLMARFVFGPVARPDLALMTPENHGQAVFAASIVTSAWYAFLIACLVFHFGFSLSMRSRVGVAYGVTLSLALVFVAYLDGFLFRFLYPADPERHLGIGLAILLAVAAAGFTAAALSLSDLAERGKGKRLCLIAAAASLCAIALVLLLSPEIMANAAYAAFVAMLVTQAVAAPQWRRVSGMPRALLQWLTLALATTVAVLLALVLMGKAPSWMPLAWQIKTLFAAAAVWTIAALSLGLVSMRRDHEATLRRELQAVSERERVARDLLDSERNYAHARALADRRRAQLATASHDFRQPLASLRLTLTELGGRLDAERRRRLEDAFDYMDDISSDLLEDTRDGGSGGEDDGNGATEPYPLSLILNTVVRMFGTEAAEKGLDLRMMPSSRQTSVPPLILTRIVGNLISNSVKYTETGRVLIGVRSGGPGRLRIAVCDTGPGLSQEDLARFREAYAKGDDSAGTGLGLAICHDLAAQHGLAISARSRPGTGTCFLVDIPRAIVPGQSTPAQ